MIRLELGGNDSVEHKTKPSFDCGWGYVAENGPWTAIGKRLLVGVAHINYVPPAVVFGSEQFNVIEVIRPGFDLVFLVVDRDMSAWCPPYLGTRFTGQGTIYDVEAFMVASGYGYGRVDEQWFYHDGGIETQAKRWCAVQKIQWSDETFHGTPYATASDCLLRFDEGTGGVQDSGYPAFIRIDGVLQCIGPIQGAIRPARPGMFSTSAQPLKLVESVIAPYLDDPIIVPPPPPPPPPPIAPVVSSPRLEFAVDVSSPPGVEATLEASAGGGEPWEAVMTGSGTFTYREPATGKARFFRARSSAI